MEKLAVVTGSSGSLGIAIVDRFKRAGYLICGLDITRATKSNVDFFIEVDLNEFVLNETTRKKVILKIKKWTKKEFIRTIINNAAYQFVSDKHPIDILEISKSYNINVVAPYILTTHLANLISPKIGCVVNVGSIHSRLTKPGFLAYSITKSALSALTRALAIDYQNLFRINCIEPAAIDTAMLLQGFNGNKDKFKNLENCHPQKRISTTSEIAEMIYLINSKNIRFLHGASIDMSGGISGRLNDPV